MKVLEGRENPLEKRTARVASTYVTRKIVEFTIVEAIAVCGLVLALVGIYLSDPYFFYLISSPLLIIEFPSKPLLEEMVAATPAGNLVELAHKSCKPTEQGQGSN